MNENEKLLAIEKELFNLAFYFNETRFTKKHFEIYAKDLIENDLDNIKKGCELYRKDPKNSFFPVPPTKILMYLKEDDNEATYKVIEDIMAAVVCFGWNNSSEAKKAIGADGWDIVTSFGGWNSLCQNLGRDISLTMFNSQAREFIKSKISRNRKNPKNNDEKIKIETKKTTTIDYKEKEVTDEDRKNLVKKFLDDSKIKLEESFKKESLDFDNIKKRSVEFLKRQASIEKS